MQASRLEELAENVAESAPREYSQFWQLWREEKFFECHEVLEDLWRATPDESRIFLNGLIHAAVAIYQHRRGNAEGAARQLVRARAKLKYPPPLYAQVNAAELAHAVEEELESSLRVLAPSQKARLEKLQREVKQRLVRECGAP